VVPTAYHRGAAILCASFGKRSKKGIPLSLNRRLEKLASSLSQEIGQRVSDGISTREIDDGSVFHGGASSNGWLDVLQLQSNQMHRHHSNRPDTRFTHSSWENDPTAYRVLLTGQAEVEAHRQKHFS
jgi:hypothetical protein